MVYKKLSEEDKIIIKYLRQKFGYGAKRIIKNHPEKNWGLRNVGYLLKKIDETGDVERREGSGRPKSSRTENNINAVKELISSQEDKSGTHATPNEISKMMDIPRTLIRRIIAEDLKLQPFKKIKGQRIDTRTKEKHIKRCPNLLRVFTKQVLKTAFFSDEKIFKVTQLLNVQNDRTYAPSAYNKSTIENKRLYVESSGFPMSLMVSVALSKVGKSSVFFVEPGAKVNGAYYREKLLASMIPEMDRLTGYQPYVFMQDGARSHTANETVRFLNQQRHLTLLQPNMWPPNSPDLNPVDYCVWSALERNVYRGRRFENTIEFKEAIFQEWEALPQAVINNTIDGFRSRVRLVIAENGQHIENY